MTTQSLTCVTQSCVLHHFPVDLVITWMLAFHVQLLTNQHVLEIISSNCTLIKGLPCLCGHWFIYVQLIEFVILGRFHKALSKFKILNLCMTFTEF